MARPPDQAPKEPYLTGFGNELASEAHPGALPSGQNSPQKNALGLYTEKLSGSAFTAPRAETLRSWLYRIRPSAQHLPFRRVENGHLQSAPFDAVETSPNRLRWDPLPIPAEPADFVDGLVTLAGNGDAASQTGLSVHIYLVNRPMRDRVFVDADGELLIVPQDGELLLMTEFGLMRLGPGEIGVVPRGVRFRVEVPQGKARGYICENHGAPFRLPELGPIGSDGLANPRDFLVPTARFESRTAKTEIVQKFLGCLWATVIDHSPFDVVAWHGNYVPYKYDLARFNTLGTVSFDHPDPSLFTVLTSPSERAGMANVDFVIFPPRWMVAEHTFRPPWFHRNIMSEFMGLVRGSYEAKSGGGFLPGGASLHNCMTAHGPDVASTRAAMSAPLTPTKIEGSLAFMFETRFILRPTRFALETSALQATYDETWTGFPMKFQEPAP